MWRRRPSTALSEWPLRLGGHTPQGEPVLLRPLVKGSEELLIYMLLDGALVRRFLPESLWGAALPAYYMLLAGSIVLSVRFFFRHSRWAYSKFSACPG